MKKKYNKWFVFVAIIILIPVVLLSLMYIAPLPKGEFNDYGWDLQSIGTNPTKNDLFYPDAYANYWKYTFKSKDLKENQALKISGIFPKAKYMSYNIYNQKTFSTMGSIYDTQMKTMDGKEIIQGVSKYEVIIAHNKKDLSPDANVLLIPEGVDKASVMLRYYDAEVDQFGGVELPTITAYNKETKDREDMPKSIAKRIPAHLAGSVSRLLTSFMFKQVNRDGDLYSYRFDAGSTSVGGLLSNYDNKYLIMPMIIKEGEVAFLRFIPPKVSSNIYDNKADVRYWSLGFGDSATRNVKTYSDKELKTNEDGYIYVAITTNPVINPNSYKGINVIEWTKDKKLMLIYRNLLTREDYKYDLSKAVVFPISLPLKGTPASDSIGDYAPKGKIITAEDFETKGKSIFK